MALRQKRWRFGKKRSKHREVRARCDATPFFAALSSRKRKNPPRIWLIAARPVLQNASYRRLPQKRWMRLQASSRSEVLVAYEIRNAGPSPNAEPCTTATPSFSKSSVTKSSSLAITLPDGEVLPMVPAQDG